jgi:NTP pyrophosphatase (non-canonical NTP hydrolase)
MSTVRDMPAQILFRELNRCYDIYLQKHDISADPKFFLLKFVEEFGELARLLLASENLHPKVRDQITAEKLNEEGADFICQAIILVMRYNLDIWPAMRKKWLQETQLDDLR